MKSAQWTPWHSYYFLGILCLLGISSVLDRQILNVLVDPIRADLGIDDVQIGYLQGFAFSVFYVLFGLPMAYLADLGDRRKLIAAGVILWSIMTVVGGLAQSFTVLFIARALVGVGEAALNPCAYALCADMFRREALARAIGVFSSANALATGLSVVATGGLATWFAANPPTISFLEGLAPWRLTMITIALPAVLVVALLIFTTREPDRVRDEAPQVSLRAVWQELIQGRYFLLMVILGHCAGSTHLYAQLAWFPSYLIRTYGFTPGEVALQFGIITTVAGMVGPFVAGIVIDKLYKRFGMRAPLIVLIAIAIGALIQAFAPQASSVPMILAAYGLGYMIYTGSNPAVGTILQMAARPTMRARVTSIWVSLANATGMTVGAAVVPLITRHFFDGKDEAIRYSITISSVVCLMIMLSLHLWAHARLKQKLQLEAVAAA